MTERFIILSGCSGGGKSTLLEAVKAQGHFVVEEPGRRVVRHEVETGGNALPWSDPVAFARATIALSLEDFGHAQLLSGPVFFDRSLIDAASFLQTLTGEDILDLSVHHRYGRRVFLTPPWPEIYACDSERKHGFDEAVVEYDRLLHAYPAFGYQPVILPKASVEDRLEIILGAV